MTACAVEATEGQGARSRFARNMGANIAFLLMSTALAFWYVPFLVDRLGLAAYGVLALANSLVLYLGVVTDSLDFSISRYLAIDLRAASPDVARRTFSTACAASMAAAAVLLLPLATGVWLFPRIFEVPGGEAAAVQVLLACVLLLVVLDVLGSPYRVPMFAMHRFDLRNAVRGADLVTRTLAVVLLMWLLRPSLWQVGVGYALGGAVALIATVLICRRLTPTLRASRDDVDRRRLTELLSFSGWSLLNRVGMLLFLSTDLVIINLALGPVATGAYGTLLLFPTLLRSVTDTIASLVAPAIINRFAVGDVAGLRALAAQSVRLLGLVLALPVGLLCGMAGPFLILWLGPGFSVYATVLVLLVCHLATNLATLPLSFTLTACNRVKSQGLYTLGLGALNVAGVVLVTAVLGWGLEGVALVSALALTLRSAGVVAVEAARALRTRWWSFLPLLLRSSATTAVVALATQRLLDVWSSSGWLDLVVSGIVVTVGYSMTVLLLVLTKAERTLLKELLPSSRR